MLLNFSPKYLVEEIHAFLPSLFTKLPDLVDLLEGCLQPLHIRLGPVTNFLLPSIMFTPYKSKEATKLTPSNPPSKPYSKLFSSALLN